MPVKIKETLQTIDSLKGKKLVYLLIGTLITFSLIGVLIGNIISRNLNENEINTEVDLNSENIEVTEGVQFKGKVVYVDPNFYPSDNISYVLEDNSGKEIILLTAKDEKLSVVEGLNVIVYGNVQKTSDETEDLLMVEKVIVENN